MHTRGHGLGITCSAVPGSVKDCKWRDIKVGQILEVRDNENFPADLLCLACARPDGVAYIRTTNLDGISAHPGLDKGRLAQTGIHSLN